jgi:aspartyl protease family protein
MALSNGGRSILGDLAGWAMAIVFGIAAIIYAPEIKQAGYALLGVQPPTRTIAAATTAPERRPNSSGRNTAELSVGDNGHFFTPAEVNGRRIDVMIDTGASIIALTYDDAVAIGIGPSQNEFTHTVSTANGTARVAPVTLDRVMIGDIMVRNVQAAVIERGKLKTTLLGNSFLGRLNRYEMRNGRMLLEE